MFYGYFGDLGDLFARSKSTKPDLCQLYANSYLPEHLDESNDHMMIIVV